LTDYAQCPYRFFVQHVLRIEPLEDLGLEVDHRQRGSTVHSALERLHAELLPAWSEASLAELDAEAARVLVQGALTAALPRPPEHDEVGAALAEVDRRILVELLDRYPEQYRRYFEAHGGAAHPRPTHFEVSFGIEPASADSASTTSCLEIRRGDDVIRVRGRIDRIDIRRDQDRTVFQVIDYKTGAKPSGGGHGLDLQIKLYALAARDVLFRHQSAEPLGGGYWYLKDKGYKQSLELAPQAASENVQPVETPAVTWSMIADQVRARVAALVAGVRGGQFPMLNADEKCTTRCEFHTVCRVRQTRSLEKTWRLPAPADD
jgi:ATP-dependent helicase/nuclease subunit B